jgi:5-methyltetrahydrofolate--homocysteine methyltransferase
VILGGAALTRTYVEQDLNEIYGGEVRYARDAFEGLALMDAVMAVKRGEPGASLPQPRQRRVAARKASDQGESVVDQTRSDVARAVEVPTPPFWGSRVVRGIKLAEVAQWLDHRATFMGQWGLRAAKDQTYESLVEAEGLPRLRMWLDRIQIEGLAEFAVTYGYWPCYSSGNDLAILDPDNHARQLTRFTFPRQTRDRRLCLADYFRDESEASLSGPDVIAFQLVTMGSRVSKETARLFDGDSYREYLELHGLSVQLTEALAELWHSRVREELAIGGDDGDAAGAIRDQAYRGSRYSLGYPACPDLEDRSKLVELLEPGRIGVTLSQEFQLHPEQSTDAMIVHHPEAKYFNAH